MARVAVTGAAGQLGRQLVRAFEAAGNEVRALTHADFDITDAPSVADLVAWRPDVVVNSAAWTDVEGCARDPERAMRVNGEAAGLVAAAAARAEALAVQVSTNEVFDGSGDRAYAVDDEPNPINAYGRSKLAGERATAAACPRHLIVRTAWLFGPGGTNFVTKILAAAGRAADAGEPLRLVADEFGNPTWTPDLAQAIVALCARASDPPGQVVHAAGMPPASRLEWARVALDAAGRVPEIQPVSLADFPRDSTPPPRAVLAPSDGVPGMDWRPATVAMVAEVTAAQPS
jgi:dTDP-4-dehydrorhamnose reductase